MTTQQQSLTYDPTAWGLWAARPCYRSGGVGCIVVGGVARQQPVLLRASAVVAAGLRNTLLCCLHHLLVLAPAVLEPDLNLQHTERVAPFTGTSFLLDYELQYCVCLLVQLYTGEGVGRGVKR